MYQRITIIFTYDAWTNYHTKTQIKNEFDVFSLENIGEFLKRMDNLTLKYKLLIRGVKKIEKKYIIKIINDKKCMGLEYRHSFDKKKDVIFNKQHIKYAKNMKDMFGLL